MEGAPQRIFQEKELAEMAHCAPLRWRWGLRCVATMRFSASFSRTQTGRSGFGGSIRSGRFGDRQRRAEIALGRGYDSADLVIEVGRAGGDPASCAKLERPAVERAHEPPPPATRFPSASANLSGKPSAGQDRGGPAEDTAPRPAQGRLVIPLAMTAYDLVRPPKLLARAASPPAIGSLAEQYHD
jgi:hypothetical protein